MHACVAGKDAHVALVIIFPCAWNHNSVTTRVDSHLLGSTTHLSSTSKSIHQFPIEGYQSVPNTTFQFRC